jgi:mRNA-degrading endonuclease RelE of RelBE toxin-antitoxin system
MRYRIEFSPVTDRELKNFAVFEQRRVTDAIRQHLLQTPNVETRNRKCLGFEVTANFEFVPPLWELRVGGIRVFYEIDDAAGIVYIDAVRRKPPDRTTDKVLHDTNPS